MKRITSLTDYNDYVTNQEIMWLIMMGLFETLALRGVMVDISVTLVYDDGWPWRTYGPVALGPAL